MLRLAVLCHNMYKMHALLPPLSFTVHLLRQSVEVFGQEPRELLLLTNQLPTSKVHDLEMK